MNITDIHNKRILSGITPSGDGTLHIGNYLGAVKQFKQLAENNDCFLFVADLHALTTIQDKGKLAKNIETLVLSELALLGDLKNITFFRQSDVPMHTELQTILSNVTPLGLLKRAHAYKDKLGKDVNEEDINLGLFNYPILMASDILMYRPDLVPVGKDQKQHIEIARDVGGRFNKTFAVGNGASKKEVFKLPEGFIPEEVATIVGTDGKRKMSKSLGNVISIFEPEEVIKKQVNSCYTDPTRVHATDPGHIEGNMVFVYLDFFPPDASTDAKAMVDKKAMGGRGLEKIKELYTQGKVGDVEIKEYLFESLMKTFAPARARFEELKANPKLVAEILESGADKARIVAKETMIAVREAIGLMTKYSFFTYPFRDHDGPITIDDFSAVEMRVGKVTEAENVEKSEKLIRLHVDFGEFGKRTIFTGVRTYGYTPETFTGKQFFFVVNLQARKMMGEESQGMIMAASNAADATDKPIFISAEGMSVGSKIR